MSTRLIHAELQSLASSLPAASLPMDLTLPLVFPSKIPSSFQGPLLVHFHSQTTPGSRLEEPRTPERNPFNHGDGCNLTVTVSVRLCHEAGPAPGRGAGKCGACHREEVPRLARDLRSTLGCLLPSSSLDGGGLAQCLTCPGCSERLLVACWGDGVSSMGYSRQRPRAVPLLSLSSLNSGGRGASRPRR